MNSSLTRTGVWTVAVRNYWWSSTLIGLYFAGGFWLWHGSRAALSSSTFFLLSAILGLGFHNRLSRNRLPQVGLIVGHLLLGQAVLVWQKSHLPLGDYSISGNLATRELIIYLVSTLITGTMSMFGGVWGALIGLSVHYAFIFDIHEEFSVKWLFPVFVALGGIIISSAFWRLDRAYAKVEMLASRDNLTGLLNRHRLDSEFERLQARARESARPLLLVAWDLDGLKQINDQQGHAAGDAQIRKFADALRANVRKSSDERDGDAAFRVGGDEFISMHLDIHDGEKLMERVHHSCSQVSAGWILCNTLTLDQALTQADKALYRSKVNRKDNFARATSCE